MTKLDRVAVLLLTMPGIFAVLRLLVISTHEPWWLQAVQHVLGRIG